MEKICIPKTPIYERKLDFLYAHLDCDCIIKNSSETTDLITVVAYALSKDGNGTLRNYYIDNDMKGKFKPNNATLAMREILKNATRYNLSYKFGRKKL